MNSLIRAQVWSRLGRRRHVHQAGWTTVSHHVRFNTANHHPPPPQSTRPQRQRYVRPLVYASTFLLLGLTIAQPFRQALDARLLIPDSPEDVLLLNRISAEADQLPIVKTLRSPGTTATWQEWDAYASMPVSERLGRLTSGPMRGARGLALQRVFWNQQDQKAVSIIWLGSDLCGWPGVVHGGAIATVMDESLGRAAIRRFPAKTGVTASLELKYLAPTRPNQFYILRAECVPHESTDRKAMVRGRLESLQGKICAEASGLFVVPKGFTLPKLPGDF